MGVTVETFGIEEERSRRYRGLNPAFAERVWRQRRAAAKPKKTIGEIVAEYAAKRRAEQSDERIAEMVSEIENAGVMEIIDAVAKAHGFTVAHILGTCRSMPVVKARHQAMVEVVKRRPGMSIPRIGRFFRRDHTTIIHAMKKHGVSRK